MGISGARPNPTAASPGRRRISPTSCAAPSDDRERRRRIYGRRRGRPLRQGQRALLEELRPQREFFLPEHGGLDPHALFPGPVEDVWLEVGFGAGEHLAAQAAAHPGIGMIGCEVFENGVAKLLGDIARRNLANIRLFLDDARLLIARLAPASLGRVFILFPDPWPKERHKKRRIVSAETLDGLAQAMRGGAELRLATDDPDYARVMLERVTAHPAFRWLARRAADWRTRPEDWPPTRYEQKAIGAERPPMFLRFARR
jgi:tRNA (guanine-N7-)-methyltransferase